VTPLSVAPSLFNLATENDQVIIMIIKISPPRSNFRKHLAKSHEKWGENREFGPVQFDEKSTPISKKWHFYFVVVVLFLVVVVRIDVSQIKAF
jgi:hypothetical protein